MKLSSMEKNKKLFLWTDSEIVLSWMKKIPDKEKFLRRQLDEIKNFGNLLVAHTTTDENPADSVSRGQSAKDLKQSKLWWLGPSRLLKKQHHLNNTEFFNRHRIKTGGKSGYFASDGDANSCD